MLNFKFRKEKNKKSKIDLSKGNFDKWFNL